MRLLDLTRARSVVARQGFRDLSILLFMLVASRIALYTVTSYTADDAFITYRYAENLAYGKGFLFNEGEKVQGTSSPLYTVVQR